MTFAPYQRQPVILSAATRTRIASRVRTTLFWVMTVLLAVLLWQMVSRKNGGKSIEKLNYSDFMTQVDQNNIGSVRLYTSQSTAEIRGKLRQPSQDFRVTIPKESIPDLTERLRKNGAAIDVATGPESNWRTVATDVLPLLVIVALWMFKIKQTRPQHRQLAVGDPSSRPLG